MKRFTAIVMIAAVSVTLILLPLKADYSPRNTATSYMVLRAVSATDDTGLAADKTTWEDVQASTTKGQDVTAGRVVGTNIVRMRGKGATGSTANWVWYAAKTEGEPFELVAYGTATLGTTTTGNTDEFWFNTPGMTAESGIMDVEEIAGLQYNLGTGVVASGGIGKLVTDNGDYAYHLFLMSKGTATACGADIAAFK